jgi:predicted DNA-binding ribbon-helix-helix protein
MAVIEATRPAFWVQLAESTQPSVKPANSHWQFAISQNQPFKTFSAFLRVLCGKWVSRVRSQKAGCL